MLLVRQEALPCSELSPVECILKSDVKQDALRQFVKLAEAESESGDDKNAGVSVQPIPHAPHAHAQQF